jgi:D-glycero-D-manno-heptose 1,7-bisphosphate phosphatase
MNVQKKAVFLDRDGVINVERGDYISRFEDFEILPHVAPGLQCLRDAGFIFIVITNQGGIAKGLYDVNELSKMHAYMESELLNIGVQFADIYYCPHHPDFGNCLCRKPHSLLVEKAISKHRINPENSIFIGDKPRDIACGEAAGVKGILIEPNENWISKIEAYL